MSQHSPTGGYERIASGLYLEGLAVDYVRNVVWYSDVIGGGIHGLGPDGSVASFNRDRKWTGGIMLNEDGAVLSSGAGGIMWNQPQTGASGWLVRDIGGVPINGINEMMPDGSGGIYFGTVDIDRIVRGQRTRPAALYRLTTAGEVILLADGLGFANGMMLSADGARLYYNDSFDSTYVFDVLPDRSLTRRTRLLEKKDCDGMALDADGTLWITGFTSSDITRLRPDGTLLEPIKTPADAITQIRFGGRDMCDYYITCVPADGGANLAVGIQPTEPASHLYRGRSSVAGLPIPAARFTLA